MSALSFWKTLSSVLAGLCLWFGIGWRRALQSSADPLVNVSPLSQGTPSVQVQAGALNAAVSTSDGGDMDREAQAAAAGQPTEVVLPEAVVRRLSDRIGSPLTGTPPSPMKWDRDQLTLLGLTDSQIDALNAAAARAGEAALAEMKRVIRPLSEEDYRGMPKMIFDDSQTANPNRQLFIVPDWHLVLATGRAALNSEILSIAGRKTADLLAATTERYWPDGDSTRILTVEDRENEGWQIRDSILSNRGSSSGTTMAKELPAQWKALFQVAEEPAPAQVGK